MPEPQDTESLRGKSMQIVVNEAGQGNPLFVLLASLDSHMKRVADAMERLAPATGEQKPKRPTLDAKEAAALAALAQFGADMAAIAEATGIGPRSLYRLRRRGGRFGQAYNAARAPDRSLRGYKSKSGDLEAWDPEDVE